MPDAFDFIDVEPEKVEQIQSGERVFKPKDAFDVVMPINKEPVMKSFLRNLAQIPSGFIQKFTYPLDIIQMMGVGHALDPEEIDNLRQASERMGIPFDEQKYIESVQNAASYFPTQGNIEKIIEEKTGIPLEAKTSLQKSIKLGSASASIAPGSLSQKAVAGVAAPSISQGLQKVGVPEPIADIAGLGTGVGVSTSAPKVTVSTAKKPSGLPIRRFEKIDKKTEISEGKLKKIEADLESDFKSISDEIVKESPISKTATELEKNPAFKQEVGKKFKKTLSNKSLSKKGISPSEYEKEFSGYLKEFSKDIDKKEIFASDLVEQYRKNNKSLSELYNPSKSYAANRAKKDSLLEYNRAIADVIDLKYPKTEFSKLFKETNKQWSEISDVEAINGFIDKLFDGKIDFSKGKKLFDNKNLSKPFERALGDKYPRFEQLVKDMLSSEKAFNMLKKAEKQGYKDLVMTGAGYIIHPTLGTAKAALSIAKSGYKSLSTALIDKPQLIIEWEKGVNALKSGNFKDSEKFFNKLDNQVKKKT